MSHNNASPNKHPDNTLEEYTETLLTPEDREEMIAESAYSRAQQHGFDPKSVNEDRLEAEKEIDKKLCNEILETEAHK